MLWIRYNFVDYSRAISLWISSIHFIRKYLIFIAKNEKYPVKMLIYSNDLFQAIFKCEFKYNYVHVCIIAKFVAGLGYFDFSVCPTWINGSCNVSSY